MTITGIRMHREGAIVSLFVTEATSRRAVIDIAVMGGGTVPIATGETTSVERCVARGTWEDVKPQFDSYMRVKDW